MQKIDEDEKERADHVSWRQHSNVMTVKDVTFAPLQHEEKTKATCPSPLLSGRDMLLRTICDMVDTCVQNNMNIVQDH